MLLSRLALPLLLLAFAACDDHRASSSASSGTTTNAAAVQRLDPAEFKATAEREKGLYLDVRTPGEVARGQIAGASNIDVNDPSFEQKVKLLDPKRPIFVYCAAGGRSRDASDRLAKMGFEHVYDLSGGMTAWKSAGLPVDAPAAAAPAAPGLTPEAFDAELKDQPLVLVDFQTPWCTPCKTMAPIVDELARTYAGRAKVLRVDVDRSEALATREKVQGVPVFVVYAQGKEKWRTAGATTREVLAAQLDGAK
jgi:thioredoxin